MTPLLNSRYAIDSPFGVRGCLSRFTIMAGSSESSPLACETTGRPTMKGTAIGLYFSHDYFGIFFLNLVSSDAWLWSLIRLVSARSIFQARSFWVRTTVFQGMCRWSFEI